MNSSTSAPTKGLLLVISLVASGLLAYSALAPSSSAAPSTDRDDRGVRDDHVPAATRLGPRLKAAFSDAAADAADDGVTLHITSGWRSRAYQAQLLREAVTTYGSRAEAARWVATPDTSPHVSGDAVDVGPTDAMSWLSQHGAAYGLCQIYANELWHYELRPSAEAQGCPDMYADPTQDPRMRR